MGQRRIVRHLLQPQRLAQLLPFAGKRDNAAIVGAQKLAQHKKRKKLGLRVVMARKAAAKGTVGYFVRGAGLSSEHEALAEDDGELCFGLEPLARRPLPFLGGVIEHEI